VQVLEQTNQLYKEVKGSDDPKYLNKKLPSPPKTKKKQIS
jgi:hypothetical protein